MVGIILKNVYRDYLLCKLKFIIFYLDRYLFNM